MTTVIFHGNPVALKGDKLVAVGDKLVNDYKLTTTDLADVSLEHFVKDGNALVLNIFPSVDTGVCATSVREFNARLNGLDGVKVVCVSADLPFATSRFCGAEGLENVVNASFFRHKCFADKLGLLIAEGPLAGLSARAVVVLDKDLTVKYVQLSPEVGLAVDFDKAIDAVKAL